MRLEETRHMKFIQPVVNIVNREVIAFGFNEKLEMKLQKIFKNLSPKQGTILFDYMTETSNKCSDLNEFYYRMGLRDGLMLKEVIQVMLDALTE